MIKLSEMSVHYLGKKSEELSPAEQQVLTHLHDRKHISKPLPDGGEITLGQKLADRVASFGGSWMFIFICLIFMLAWIVLNTYPLIKRLEPFDPSPYILLNLLLALVATLQAPVILMAQNRQSEKERQQAAQDYKINLKAELEILSLHGKIDHLSTEQWMKLMLLQQQQIDLLNTLIKKSQKRKSKIQLKDQ